MVATGGLRAVSVLGMGDTERTAGASAVESKVCSHFVAINWYDRFVTGPDVMRFSPEQKLRLAMHNLINPFNLGTIVGEAGYSIGTNAHTPYGPGFAGWGKLSGTNFTQDMTGEFFGTFLIPSITHTDAHYHRRPDLNLPRRILHCIDQVAWQRDDNGRHTLNYSQIVAPVFDISISNLYVPGLQTHFSADAERYGVGLATAPIDNFITEFVPSIASRIHTHVVFAARDQSSGDESAVIAARVSGLSSSRRSGDVAGSRVSGFAGQGTRMEAARSTDSQFLCGRAVLSPGG